MAAKKITVKDLASEVEKLSEIDRKKYDLIKALDEKIIILGPRRTFPASVKR